MVLITLILDSENNVFFNVTKPLFAEKGYACLVGNDFGGKSCSAPQGNCSTSSDIQVDSLDGDSNVKNVVTSYAGTKLSF